MTQGWGEYSELPCKKRVKRVHDVNEKRTMCSSSPQFKDDEKILSLNENQSQAGEAMKSQPGPGLLEAAPPPLPFSSVKPSIKTVPPASRSEDERKLLPEPLQAENHLSTTGAVRKHHE